MSTNTPSGERTPLLPPPTASRRASSLSAAEASPSSPSPLPRSTSSDSSTTAGAAPPSSTGSAGKAKVRVGLDSSVVDAQKKWKQLTEINDDNCTAKDMASEVQSEFAALRQQQQQQLHRMDIAEEDEEDLQQTPPTTNPPSYGRYFFQSGPSSSSAGPLSSEYHAATTALHVDKYLIAAAFIRDGIHGRKIGYRLDRTALFLHEFFHSGSYRMLYTLIVLISCGLAFLERPGEQNEYLLVDLLCTFLFGVDVYIRWTMSSLETKRKFLSRQPWACVRMGLLVITVLDLVTNLLLPAYNPYRYSRALRPFFLITRRRNIRIIFGSCLRALREVLIVLLLMFCLIGFFGLLGFLLFSDLSVSTNAPFFASLQSSMYTMLLIHNCLPYMVKAMYPYFKVTEWTALYFVIFVLLTNLFLAKLTIAVSYKSYKKHTESMLYKRLQKRKAALEAAFEILATDVDLVNGDQPPPTGSSSSVLPPPSGPSSSSSSRFDWRRGSSRFFTSSMRASLTTASSLMTPLVSRRISLDTWLHVCEYLKPQWTSVEGTLVFNTIDIEHVGHLDLADFYQLCSFLSVKLERTSPSMAATILRWFWPSLPRQRVRTWQLRLRRLLLHEAAFGRGGKYRVVVAELVVGVLICLSVIQAVQVNNITLAFSVNHKWRVLGIVLLCLFTLEVPLKLFAFGRREFFARPFCKLDLAIVIVGWVFYGITTMNDPPQVSLVFYDLALAVRSLRILKLLNLFPPFHEILWTMQRILPLIVQLLLVILSVMYAFAIITQANYGLALRTFPASKASLSPNWYAVREEFQVDTFAETLETLFGVANLAGWDIVMDAAHAMTQRDTTYVFFFTYRIVMANILLPIFVGFLVESFVSNAKSVENTIETYVEAAHSHHPEDDGNDHAAHQAEPSLEEARLALLQSKDMALTTHNDQATSSPASDRAGFRMRFERKGSMVQNEMFDAVRLSDVSRLKLLVEKKDEEIAAQDLEIRKLESNVLGMQTRLGHAQRVLLAYESKMEELSAALAAANQQIQQGSMMMTAPTSASTSSTSSQKRTTSWKVWSK